MQMFTTLKEREKMRSIDNVAESPTDNLRTMRIQDKGQTAFEVYR